MAFSIVDMVVALAAAAAAVYALIKWGRVAAHEAHVLSRPQCNSCPRVRQRPHQSESNLFTQHAISNIGGGLSFQLEQLPNYVFMQQLNMYMYACKNVGFKYVGIYK